MKKWLAVFIAGCLALAVCGAATDVWSISSGSAATASISSFTGTAKGATSTSVTVSRGVTQTYAEYFYVLITGCTTANSQYTIDNRRVYNSSSIANNSVKVFLRRASGSAEVGTDNVVGTYVIMGSIAANASTKTFTFYAYTGSGAVPAAGYTNTFNYTVYQTGTTNPAPSYTLTSTSANVVGMGTLGVTVTSTSGGTFTVNSITPSTVTFDTLVQPDQTQLAKTATLNLTASMAFKVAARSVNYGKLILAGTTDTLTYTMSCDGVNVPLTTGTVIMITSSGAVTNKNYTLSFSITPMDMQDPGPYSDSLYLTFSDS